MLISCILYIQAGASLLHNLVCYMVYYADKACLPFIMFVTGPFRINSTLINKYRYAILVDCVFLGLQFAAVFMGGIGLGIFYRTLCILS